MSNYFDPFAFPRAKVERADSHLKHLNKLFDEWAAHTQVRLQAELNDEGTYWIIRLWKPPPPPPLVTIMLGEAFHQLRSCLDHAAFAINRALGKEGLSPHQVAFPVGRDQTAFDDECTRHVAKNAMIVTHFREMQPYCDGHGDVATSPLWVLHRADIVFKHRYEAMPDLGMFFDVVPDDLILLQPVGTKVDDGEPFAKTRVGPDIETYLKTSIPRLRKALTYDGVGSLDASIQHRVLEHVRDNLIPRIESLYSQILQHDAASQS